MCIYLPVKGTARKNVHLTFPAPPLPPSIEPPLFVHRTDFCTRKKKLKLTKKEREQAEFALVEFGETGTVVVALTGICCICFLCQRCLRVIFGMKLQSIHSTLSSPSPSLSVSGSSSSESFPPQPPAHIAVPAALQRRWIICPFWGRPPLSNQSQLVTMIHIIPLLFDTIGSHTVRCRTTVTNGASRGRWSAGIAV